MLGWPTYATMLVESIHSPSKSAHLCLALPPFDPIKSRIVLKTRPTSKFATPLSILRFGQRRFAQLNRGVRTPRHVAGTQEGDQMTQDLKRQLGCSMGIVSSFFDGLPPGEP